MGTHNIFSPEIQPRVPVRKSAIRRSTQDREQLDPLVSIKARKDGHEMIAETSRVSLQKANNVMVAALVRLK